MTFFFQKLYIFEFIKNIIFFTKIIKKKKKIFWKFNLNFQIFIFHSWLLNQDSVVLMGRPEALLGIVLLLAAGVSAIAGASAYAWWMRSKKQPLPHHEGEEQKAQEDAASYERQLFDVALEEAWDQASTSKDNEELRERVRLLENREDAQGNSLHLFLQLMP